MPRFAWSASAGLVEPISSIADDGFPARYEAPAQWFNYLFHYSLAWSDFLRGPGWGAWTRAAHGGSAATFTSITGLAVDADDTRARAQRYRYAITGAASGPAAKIAVSRNGLTWQDRAVPTGVGTVDGIAQVGVYWVVWCDGGTTQTAYRTPVHDGSSSSGIGTSDATYWTLVSALGGLPIRGIVKGGSDIYALQRGSAGQYNVVGSSDDGTTWPYSAGTAWVSGGARATSIAYDDSRSRHIVSSSIGQVAALPPLSTFPTGGGALGTMSGIPTDARVQLVVGGPSDARTLLAWASYREDGTTALSATLLWRSTDGGTTWSAITVPTAWGATITDLAHVDGSWIATQSAAPYLWRSDDDGQNWERLPLPVTDTLADWPLQRAVYADGQIVATGLTWTVYSTRASATSPGTWTSREPVYLADAGYLRGRTISTTAPTNGQTLVWNSSTSQWVPTTVASGSPTTTRGDLIVRGASADQRLAIGAAGRYARSDGTDPAWSQLLSSDLVGFRQNIPLAGYATTVSTSDAAIGGAYFAPADYAISGRTTVLTLEAIGQVVSGVTGTLTLHNLTDATDDATLSWTETSATRKTASVTLPGAAKIYELRFKKSGGAASDYAVISTATLRTTWS
jgi:hypothetical protein